jgi:flagellar biosynthesis/type III secretory pathway M-ring protein FliF/YscJ
MTQDEQYRQITQIIQDQIALEEHQRNDPVTFNQIQFSRVDAYRQIVRVVTGVDIVLSKLPRKG